MAIQTSRGGGSGVAGLSWDKNLGENLRQGKATFLVTLQLELQLVAMEMESFAKANHPWRNQTGEAERTFTVRVVGVSTILAQHGVPYGKWLELKFGGRYGIMPATLDVGKAGLRDAMGRAWMASWRFA